MPTQREERWVRDREAMEKAHNLGVKLISYEELMKNSDVDLFISFNNLRVGELQGRYLIEKVQKGNYIVLEGSGGGELFKEGAMEYIEPLVNWQESYIGYIKINNVSICYVCNPAFLA